jgi:MerR family transcriptional regulator/heat shock protein HspR
MTLPPSGPDRADAALSDTTFPAYSMSAAVAILGVAPGFLRGLGDAGLLDPARSQGGHRRYSHDDLRLAARARELVDDGMSLAAACRIVHLEHEVAVLTAELARARAHVAALGAAAGRGRRERGR